MAVDMRASAAIIAGSLFPHEWWSGRQHFKGLESTGADGRIGSAMPLFNRP